jgi:4-carboxymuconolactone decarboxylase
VSILRASGKLSIGQNRMRHSAIELEPFTREERLMTRNAPGLYDHLQQTQPQYIAAVEQLGTVVRQSGPLDPKTVHLVQLAAAAAIRSEGAVHSHVRRGLESGASLDEIRHAIIALTSTIGFPNVMAALSWIEDVAPSA